MWVADDDAKLYAYSLASKSRDAAQDVDTLGAAGNDRPRGIWSDRTTIWVADYDDNRLYAYRLPDAAANPQVEVSPTLLTVDEAGGTATYTLRLTTAPKGPVTVVPRSDDSTAAGASGPVTFTLRDWATPLTVAVTGVDDDIDNPDDRRTTVIRHSAAGGGYDAVTIADVTVTVTDDDDGDDDEDDSIAELVLQWPVAVKDIVRGALLTNDYAHYGYVDDEKYHTGIDIGAPAGTSVVAAAAGEIVFIQEYEKGCASGCEDHDLGTTIIIEHGEKVYTQYSHLKMVSVPSIGDPGIFERCPVEDKKRGRRPCPEGVSVEAGALLGKVGRTGCDRKGCGPHLHLGAALLRRRPKGLLPAARQELLDPSKAWWGGRRGRLADRPRYSISVSLGVVPRWYSRVVEVPVRIEVAAGFVAPGASEPPRLQPSWPPGGFGPAHG